MLNFNNHKYDVTAVKGFILKIKSHSSQKHEIFVEFVVLNPFR